MNWKERLDRAIVAGEFTLEDRILVSNWGTCAVGEKYTPAETAACMHRTLTGEYPAAPDELGNPQRYIPNFHHHGEEELGYDFLKAVVKGDVTEAYEIFQEIQKLYPEEKEKTLEVADPQRQTDPEHQPVCS